MDSFPLGDPVRVSVTFKNNAGTVTDPTTVTAKVRAADGTIATHAYPGDGTVVRDSTGVYHVDITTTAAGVWSYRFIGSGALVAANEAEFFAQPSDFGASG